MKKLLNVLVATILISSATTTIISCGISAKALMERKIDPEVYKSTMVSSINTWSYPSTQLASDSLILENLYDGLLTPNANGEMEGQLADWWGSDAEGKNYYFHIRNKKVGETEIPYWIKAKNGKVSQGKQVEPMDFYNSFRFDFNPNVAAEGVGVTNELFLNGSWLVNFLSTLNDYDIKNLEGKNFDRNSLPENEAISTRKFDAIIMLVNLWTKNDSNGMLKKLMDNEFETINPDEKNSKYKENKAAEELIKLVNDKYVNATQQAGTNFEQLITNSAINGGMMSIPENDSPIGDASYNLKMTLENPSSSFFESAASYGSLHPIPDFAVNYKDYRSWYSYTSKYSPKDEMEFTGAYYVSEYIPTTRTILLANPYYYKKDKINIKKAIFNVTKTASVDAPRLWFESGDLTEVAISPNDEAGWRKYVGDDYNSDEQKFVFDGTHATTAIPSQYTFVTFYNYARKKDKSDVISNESLALSQKSVRIFLHYFLQRNPIAQYVSGRFDNEANTKFGLSWDKDLDMKNRSSQMLRNSFTTPRLSVNRPDGQVGEEYKGINQYDYTIQNVGKEYNKLTGTTNKELPEDWNKITDEETNTSARLQELMNLMGELNSEEKTKIEDYYNNNFGSLVDGNDSLYKNDLFALGMFYNSENVAITSLDDIKKEFAIQAKKNALDSYQNSKSLDHDNEVDTSKILTKVIKQDFMNMSVSEINENTKVEFDWLLNSDSRLTLNPKIQYMIDRFNNSVGNDSPIKLKFSLANDSEDYNKKSNNGEYDIFVSGWGPDYTDPYNFLATMTFGGAYNVYTRASSVIKKGNGKYEAVESKYEKAYEGLAASYYAYDQLAEASKQESDFTQRLDKLSKTEIYGLYNEAMTATLYAKTPIQTVQLSYIDPFTRSSFIAGSSGYRLLGMNLIPQLWTRQQYLDAQKEYLKPNSDVQKPEEYKYIYDWNKSLKPVVEQ